MKSKNTVQDINHPSIYSCFGRNQAWRCGDYQFWLPFGIKIWVIDLLLRIVISFFVIHVCFMRVCLTNQRSFPILNIILELTLTLTLLNNFLVCYYLLVFIFYGQLKLEVAGLKLHRVHELK